MALHEKISSSDAARVGIIMLVLNCGAGPRMGVGDVGVEVSGGMSEVVDGGGDESEAEPKTYTVASGDTLSEIVSGQFGVDWQEDFSGSMALTDLLNGTREDPSKGKDLIYPGEEIDLEAVKRHTGVIVLLAKFKADCRMVFGGELSGEDCYEPVLLRNDVGQIDAVRGFSSRGGDDVACMLDIGRDSVRLSSLSDGVNTQFYFDDIEGGHVPAMLSGVGSDLPEDCEHVVVGELEGVVAGVKRMYRGLGVGETRCDSEFAQDIYREIKLPTSVRRRGDIEYVNYGTPLTPLGFL